MNQASGLNQKNQTKAHRSEQSTLIRYQYGNSSCLSEIIDPLISHARGLLEKGDTLAALAFIGSMTDGKVIPVVMDDRSDESKDTCVSAISMTASMIDADFIFMVREAWKLPQKYINRYDEIMEEYGSVGASPYAQDVAAFSLETTHGTWVASPFIKPKAPSKKRRTFGLVTFEHMPGLEGRFSNLLRDKKNEVGTLH